MNAASHGLVERIVRRNPVWLREWRASSRLAATPWLISLTGLAMTVVLGLFAMKERERLDVDLGQVLFQVYFGLSALVVTLMGPALAANSIALEREGKTWDALLMAGVEPRAIDRGKFLGAYTQLALTMFALVPAAGVPMLYGGVSYTELALGFVLLFVVGALAVRFGLAISAALPSTRMALLVTVLAAAMLCVGLMVLGVAGTKWLSRSAAMSDLTSDTVVFWPIALARVPLGFDYVRYLVVAPLALAGLAWFVLRELTVAALTTAPQDPLRALRTTLVIASPILAVTLGLLPLDKWDQVVAVTSLFSLFAFGAIVVVGAARAPAYVTTKRADAHLKASLLVWLASVLGTLIISLLGDALAVRWSWRPQSFGYDPHVLRAPADAMRLYAPAFTTFLVGAAAYARSRMSTVTKARVVVFLLPFVVIVGAALLAVGLTFANDGARVEWPLAMSPLAVVFEMAPKQIASAAGLWTALGVALLGAAYLRDRKLDARAGSTSCSRGDGARTAK